MIRKGKWQREMPKLTAKIMREHYERNLDYVLSYMTEDIVWIGPLECQFICGKEKVREFLTPEQEVPVSISNVDFQLVSYSDTTCVVVGKLRAYTRPQTGLALDVEQRYTFCWKREGEILGITHIHASNPWELVSQEEKFPFHMGRYAHHFLEKMVKRWPPKLMFYDTDKHEIFLDQNDIIYIESDRTNSRIYHTGGVVEVVYSITRLEHNLSTEFLRVHRCFLINIHHVIGIKRFEIKMDNMEQIPVPEKKYMEIKHNLEELVKKHGGKKLF